MLQWQLENVWGEVRVTETTTSVPTSPCPPSSRPCEQTARTMPMDVPSGETRRGKAPPILPFSGESFDMQLDNWLSSLERVSMWNSWSDFTGHLAGRALQKWNLPGSDEKDTFSNAVEALRARQIPEARLWPPMISAIQHSWRMRVWPTSSKGWRRHSR